MKAAGELAGLYRYYEAPLISVLQQVERNGILLDAGVLEKQSAELAEQLERIQTQVFALAGEEFNLSSPKQLQSIFYEKLELPVLKKTKTGQPSTAEPVLQELAQDYELPRLILEHRSLNKLKSTYTDKLPLEVNAGTAGFTRHSSRPWRQRVDCLPVIRTCRISPSVPQRADGCDRLSWPTLATSCSPQTTRRWNCESWRICHVIPGCLPHSPAIRMCTGPQQPTSLT